MSCPHGAKKSLRLIAGNGLMLMLQILCYLTPLFESCGHFWSHISNISNMVVCTCVQIKNALMVQEEVILLHFLLRLLCISLCAQFLHLTFIGMVIISPIFRIAAYLLRFFFTRHRRILWTGTTILAKALMDILLQVLQHDVFICPLV